MIRDLSRRGREALEKEARSSCQSAYLGDRTAVCRVLSDMMLFVDTEDIQLAPHMLLSGFWESWITIAVAKHVKAGMKCVDVGANCGYYTILMAFLVGHSGKVTAFEPQKKLATLVTKSSYLNGVEKWTDVHQMAVGDSHDQVTLVDPLPGVGLKGSFTLREGVSGQKVPCTKLDSFDERYDFVKIDAEGYEPKVWAGMLGHIEQDQPTILMEFSPDSYENAEAFLDEILGAGYRMKIVKEDGSLGPAKREQVLDRGKFEMLWLSPR